MRQTALVLSLAMLSFVVTVIWGQPLLRVIARGLHHLLEPSSFEHASNFGRVLRERGDGCEHQQRDQHFFHH